MALLFLDVDHFKQINDGLGHGTGDQLLKGIALRLMRSVRTTDTVARLGGDEFVVILEGLHGEAEATRVAQILLDEIRRPIVLGEKLLNVTVSTGIAYCTASQEGESASAMLARADVALYAAKAAGRDDYRLS